MVATIKRELEKRLRLGCYYAIYFKFKKLTFWELIFRELTF